MFRMLARLTLAVVMLTGCKTVPQAPAADPVSLPIATYAKALPTVTNLRYRAIGRVPISIESIDKTKGTKTRIDGRTEVTGTNRGTVRARVFIESFTYEKASFRFRSDVTGGLVSDYEIDKRGYVRRVHPVLFDIKITGMGGFNEDAREVFRKLYSSGYGLFNSMEMAWEPVFSGPIELGSDIGPANFQEFMRRASIAEVAKKRFVSDSEIAKALTSPVPHVNKIERFEANETISGTAYFEGYEFLSTKIRAEIRDPQTSISIQGARLIDPYSGLSYSGEKFVKGHTEEGPVDLELRVVIDLPLKYGRPLERPKPSAVAPAPPIASDVPSGAAAERLTGKRHVVSPSRPGDAGSLVALYRRAMPAVATVVAGGGSETSIGSGFFVDSQHLITNRHVVGASRTAGIVMSNGRELTGEIVRTGAGKLDLAVIRVSRSVNVTPLKLATVAPDPGTPIVTIGSPSGLTGTITAGIVSSRREAGGVQFLQIDAAINPGNSGGPILDRSGKVVGVATFTLRESEGLNFAIGSQHARELVNGSILLTGN